MNGRRSVVLVGAGASVDFGLPGGEEILSYFRKYKPRREDVERYGEAFRDFYAFMGWAGPDAHKFINQFSKCQDSIIGSQADSIDLFAYYQTDFADIAKLMSVWKIWQTMDSAQEFCVRPTFVKPGHGTDGKLGPVTFKNWIATCSRLYCAEHRRAEELEPDSLTFVTFNYDLLVEQAMEKFLVNRFPDAASRPSPRVLHVHGAFHRLDKPNPRLEEIAAQAKGIRFVLETKELMPPVVREARDALEQADAIYAVGFAFHPLNCELLDLARHSRKLFALNFDGHRGVQARLETMGVPEKQIWSGGPGAGGGLGVASAAQQGFFELNPPAPTPSPKRGASRKQG
jgi:hypothetical protein